MAVTKVTASLEDETKALNKVNDDTYSGNMTAPLDSGIYPVSLSAYDDAGNVAVATAYANVSLWHSPKTDWKSTDRFNFEDYNRIKNNLVYLHEFAVSMWKSFNISDMGEDIREYTVVWDVDIFNLFESNLDVINKNIFTQDFGVSQRFFENGSFIKWNELNRIESAILSMNDLLERQKAGLRRLGFRLGSLKGVRT